MPSSCASTSGPTRVGRSLGGRVIRRGGIVQDINCGLPFAAACGLANSVQPLLTLIIVEALVWHSGSVL